MKDFWAQYKQELYWTFYWLIPYSWLLLPREISLWEKIFYVIVCGVLGGLGVMIFQFLTQAELKEQVNHHQKIFPCFWGAFWSFIFLILFATTLSECQQNYHPVSNPCGY